MRPEANNEIDLLLRRMGRRHDAARDGEARTGERHLDLDEMSSYAQNALPAAARARYTEHLAECTACRKLVTELSLSLGTVAVTAPVEGAHEASGLKKFLASLFSPLVLRYAVPALGVIVVMIVGFIILRRQGRSEFVAQMAQERKAAAPIAAPSPETPSARGLVDSPATATNKVENRNSKLDEAKPKPAPVAGEAAASAPATAPAQPAKDERASAEARPSVAAAEPPPPAAAKAAPTVEAQTETVVVSKKQTQSLDRVEPAPANETSRDRARPAKQGTAEQKTADTAEKDKAKSEPSDSGGFLRGGAGLARRRAEETKTAGAANRNENARSTQPGSADQETRTIAGRRFRKERGMWIDTAYESSTATVDMARNSEQFRALVADEPAIGTISRQLDGEVIVVWKGHAYRIR
jgi:hypothetical protein